MAGALGCDRSIEQSAAHLQSQGFKNVVCARDGNLATTCLGISMNDQGVAIETRFHCVTSDAAGCSSPTLACERFYLEKPAP